jgi:cobalamin biosynthesis protein CobD/CbiB
MKKTAKRLVRIGLLPAFWICYLEWPGNHGFVGEMIWDILIMKPWTMETLFHPVIFMGIWGQILVLASLVTPEPWARRFRWGILPMGLVCGLVLLAGILSFNLKMLLFQVPFWVLLRFEIGLFRKSI